MNKVKQLFRLITNDELFKALEELESAENDGVIPDGVVREYAKKLSEITVEQTLSTHLLAVTISLYAEGARRWKEEVDLPHFYPYPTSPWKSVEVRPCILSDDLSVETCEEGEEDFWSVYLRVEVSDTTVAHCIADFKYKKQAEDFSNILTNLKNLTNEL